MFLSDEELRALTKKKRRDAQAAVLNAMGITHKPRPDGSLVVLRAHVEKLLGGLTSPAVDTSQEPNWAAMDVPLKDLP